MLSMVRYQGAQAQLRAPHSTFTAAMSAFGFVFRVPDIPIRARLRGLQESHLRGLIQSTKNHPLSVSRHS